MRIVTGETSKTSKKRSNLDVDTTSGTSATPGVKKAKKASSKLIGTENNILICVLSLVDLIFRSGAKTWCHFI